MECGSCKHTITPGTEIMVDVLSRERSHCPFCLHILGESSASTTDPIGKELVAARAETRKKARRQFVDRSRESASDPFRCSVCDRELNKNDERIFLESEHFRCHTCDHDLATVAYREDAYRGQRWLPVVYALGDLQSETKCVGCCYAGAIARACLNAFSWMSGVDLSARKQMADLLVRSDWKVPSCDWESCFAVKQYRKTAGEGLLLL